MVLTQKSDDMLKQAIDTLSLEPIKLKLMDKKEGKGWSLEQADIAEKWYKRFLFLCGKYPNEPIVPTMEIDIFWHQHILDTTKYQDDCEKIFGYFLHHFPYFGLRGEEDAENLKKSALASLALYQKHFSESVRELSQAINSEHNIVGCKSRPTCFSCASCGNSACCSCGDCSLENIRPIPKRTTSLNPQAWH